MQQDLSAFFNSLSVPIVTAALQHLGAPDSLVRLLIWLPALSPFKLHLDKLQVRHRYAANPAFSLAVRTEVIRSLIFPALFWAAGVALPQPEVLKQIRQHVVASLQGALTQGPEGPYGPGVGPGIGCLLDGRLECTFMFEPRVDS